MIRYGVLASFLAAAALAQMHLPDPAPHQAAMKKLEFLSGRWAGSGWIQMGPEKHQFKQTEEIRLKLDGTVLQIEGLGKDDGGKPVHQALALVSWDAKTQAYRMRSYAYPGRVADAEVELRDSGFVWTMKAGGRTTRYTINVTGGQWVEVGEFSPDGQRWVKFFEMTLNRVGGS